MFTEAIPKYADQVEDAIDLAIQQRNFERDGDCITVTINNILLAAPVRTEIIRRAREQGLSVSFVNKDTYDTYVKIENTCQSSSQT